LDFAGERADPSSLNNLAPISNCLFSARGAAMLAGQGAVLDPLRQPGLLESGPERLRADSTFRAMHGKTGA